jgi:hypothetical protein
MSKWRTAHTTGALDKKRGPVANPNRAEMRRLEAENARLKRQLERAELNLTAVYQQQHNGEARKKTCHQYKSSSGRMLHDYQCSVHQKNDINDRIKKSFGCQFILY